MLDGRRGAPGQGGVDRAAGVCAIAQLGRCSTQQGEFGRAEGLLEESRALFEELGGESVLSQPIANLLADLSYSLLDPRIKAVR